MPSHEARLKKLEKKAAKVEDALKAIKADLKTKGKKADLAKVKSDLAAAQKDIKLIIKWIEAQVEWSEEVTMMLRLIDWNALATDYPGGGGTNPPQTPPDWPPQGT